jgi:hypothetical protein
LVLDPVEKEERSGEGKKGGSTLKSVEAQMLPRVRIFVLLGMR